MSTLMALSLVLLSLSPLVDMSRYCSIGINDACNKDVSCCTGFCDTDLHWMSGFGRCCQFPRGRYRREHQEDWNRYKKENDVRISRNCTCFPNEGDERLSRGCGDSECLFGISSFRVG
ncbi:hypothetical protein HDE_10689 [Halotydeus destructor]|nr:hypothetical protein HDE_10689 [Halotydeus destructor]